MTIIHPDDKAAIATALDNLRAGDITELIFRIIAKDQSVRWLSDKCHCEQGASDDELVLFGAASDITERKKTEEERERLIEQTSDTLAELQTILDTAPVAI